MILRGELTEWDIERMPSGSVDVVVRSLVCGQSLRIVLKPEEALKIGEALIRSTMPPEGYKPESYPVDLDKIVEPKGNA